MVELTHQNQRSDCNNCPGIYVGVQRLTQLQHKQGNVTCFKQPMHTVNGCSTGINDDINMGTHANGYR